MRLKQNAANFEFASGAVSEGAHASAKMAYLVELILTDDHFCEIHGALRETLKTAAALRGEVSTLAAELSEIASQVNLHPIILAICIIDWLDESDLSSSDITGSADWSDLPEELRGDRHKQAKRARSLAKDIDYILDSLNASPEVALELATQKAKELSESLQILKKKVKGRSNRKKRLFYEMSKRDIEAFYLLRVRKLALTELLFREHCGRHDIGFDPNDVDDYAKLRKRVSDRAEEVRRLIDMYLVDFGIVPTKRKYLRKDWRE